MNKDQHGLHMEDGKLILKEEVYQLVGCAMEVLNGIGHGLHDFKHAKLEWERIVI